MSVVVLGIAAVHFAVPVLTAALSSSRPLTWLVGLLNLIAAVALGASAYSALDFVSAAFGFWVALFGLSKQRAAAAARPAPSTSSPASAPSAPAARPRPPAPAPSPGITPLIPLGPARPMDGLPHVSLRGMPAATAKALLLADEHSAVANAARPGTSGSAARLLMRALSALAIGALVLAFWNGSGSDTPSPSSTSSPAPLPAPTGPTPAALTPITPATRSTAASARPAALTPRPFNPASATPSLKARGGSPAVSTASASTASSAASAAYRRQIERCLRLTDETAMQRCLVTVP